MITYEELTKKYGWADVDILRTPLTSLRTTDRLLLYQNKNFDSSAFGALSLVIVGPGRTITMESAPPEWIKDVPSQRQQYMGEVDVKNLREELGDVEN